MGGARGMNGREENMFKFSVNKLEGKRQLGSSRCRRENYIQMYLKTVLECVGWIYLTDEVTRRELKCYFSK